MNAVLQINDANLSFFNGSVTNVYLGIALSSPSGVLLSEDAWQQCKLQPLNCINQHWLKLSLDPLPDFVNYKQENQLNHYADLVYQQLHYMVQQNSPVEHLSILVPDSYNNEQLSLLLGIAQHCNIEPCALINTAVAALYHQTSQGDYLFVEQHLHGCVLSHIHVDDTVKLIESSDVSGCGLIDFSQHLVLLITQEFIRQHRFDPMHTAEHEQHLFNLIPTILASENDRVDINIASHSVRISRAQLFNDCQCLLAPLQNKVDSFSAHFQLFVCEKLARFPSILTLPLFTGSVSQEQLVTNVASINKQAPDDRGVQLITEIQIDSELRSAVSITPQCNAILWQHHVFSLKNGPALLIEKGHDFQLVSAPKTAENLSNAGVTVIAKLTLANGVVNLSQTKQHDKLSYFSASNQARESVSQLQLGDYILVDSCFPLQAVMITELEG